MKEMVYEANSHPAEILDSGKLHGFEYKIVSYGTHPCAYVCVPVGHPFYEKPYDEVDVDCHWGCTYSQRGTDGKWWIGWDYAHCEDYSGLELMYKQVMPQFDYTDNGKKWTTAEILAEVADVCKQLEEAK